MRFCVFILLRRGHGLVVLRRVGRLAVVTVHRVLLEPGRESDTVLLFFGRVGSSTNGTLLGRAHPTLVVLVVVISFHLLVDRVHSVPDFVCEHLEVVL